MYVDLNRILRHDSLCIIADESIYFLPLFTFRKDLHPELADCLRSKAMRSLKLEVITRVAFAHTSRILVEKNSHRFVHSCSRLR